MYSREGAALVQIETIDGKEVRFERQVVGDELRVKVSHAGIKN